MLDRRQIVAARALLGWNQNDLAAHAEIGSATVKNYENGRGNTTPVVMRAIQRTLEDHGIEFINKRSGVIGVTLKTME